MNENIKWLNLKKIERTIEALEKNNMKGYLAKDKNDLLQIVKDIAKEGELVSVGGSISLFETELIDLLRSGRYEFLDRYKENLTPADMKEIYNTILMHDLSTLVNSFKCI